MIISFGMTSAALLAGQKTVTRRDWKPEHAEHFKRGVKLDAWNTSPRNTRGKPHKIATLVLTADAVRESSGSGEVADWYAEGFDWMTEQGLSVGELTPRQLWHRWHTEPEPLYVVRFAVLEIVEPCYKCGLGREAGHYAVPDVVATYGPRWDAGDGWTLHSYQPELAVRALNAVRSS